MVHILNPCEMCGEQAGSGTGFLLSNSFSSVSIILILEKGHNCPVGLVCRQHI